MTPGISLTFLFYILSRIIYEPWPYWEESANAYYSVNQINDVPFYFYGFEYSVVIALLYVINITILLINMRIKNKKIWVFTPMIIYTIACILLFSLNLVHPPVVDLTTWTG
ncbi:MAG: hypothetical protein ACP5D6_06000 [Kosmotogaceae bacterium]